MSEELSSLERLERLDTHELRDRAISLARRRWDIRFFWRLLETLPAADAAAGNLEASEAGAAQASGLFYEALSAEENTEVQDALRPVFIDYLANHDEQGKDAEDDARDESA